MRHRYRVRDRSRERERDRSRERETDPEREREIDRSLAELILISFVGDMTMMMQFCFSYL